MGRPSRRDRFGSVVPAEAGIHPNVTNAQSRSKLHPTALPTARDRLHAARRRPRARRAATARLPVASTAWPGRCAARACRNAPSTVDAISAGSVSP